MNTTSRDILGLARAESVEATPTVPEPSSRWKSRVLLPGIIFTILLVLLLLTSAQSLLPSVDVKVVPVIAKSVEGSTGKVTVQAPGWLEPDPHPYYVAALADGVVEELFVLEGDRVEANQVVAKLVSDDARLALNRAEAELSERRANLLSADAELTAAQRELENLVERSRAVAASEAGVAEAHAVLARTRANVVAERARALEIRDEYDRKSKLTESQAVSEANVARLRLRLDAQEAAVTAAEAQESVMSAKLAQAEADLRAAQSHRQLLIEEQRAVSVAEAAVARAKASVALAEAARDEAALLLSRMEVRSPIAGVVMLRLVSPGSKVVLGGSEYSSHVVHVYDPEKMQVRVDVPLADAANVNVGQRAEISVEVLPDRTFTGTITRMVHQADIQKNTVEVKVAIDNPSAELKPDMLARVRFVGGNSSSGGSARESVFVPSELLSRNDGAEIETLVVSGLIDHRGRVERRTIVPGTRRIGNWMEIQSGLQLGDLLIAEPSGLKPGDRVRVVGESTNRMGG